MYLYKFDGGGRRLAIAKEEVLERQRQEQKDAEEAAAEAAAAEMAAAAASRQPTEEALAVDSPASSSSPEPAAESPVAVAEPREVRAGKEFTVDVTLEQLGSMCNEAEVTDRTRSAMARAYYHGFGVMQTHNAPAAEPTATPEMEPTFKQIQKAAKEKYQQKQREEAAAAKAAAKAAEAEAKAAAKAAAAAAAATDSRRIGKPYLPANEARDVGVIRWPFRADFECDAAEGCIPGGSQDAPPQSRPRAAAAWGTLAKAAGAAAAAPPSAPRSGSRKVLHDLIAAAGDGGSAATRLWRR